MRGQTLLRTIERTRLLDRLGLPQLAPPVVRLGLVELNRPHSRYMRRVRARVLRSLASSRTFVSAGERRRPGSAVGRRWRRPLE